jgi:pyruvate dehydrogenase E1 component alpha subunit
VTEERLRSIDEEVARTIDAATEFAKGGEEPNEASLMTEVYADGGSRWRN